MLSIADLLRADPSLPGGEPSGADPLLDDDALEGAAVLDARLDPRGATGAVLFDLRTALAHAEAVAGLLVVRGVWDFQCAVAEPGAAPGALTVVSSTPIDAQDAFTLRIGTAPRAAVVLSGESAEFYVLDVPSAGDEVPVPGAVTTVRRPQPHWGSDCSVLAAFHRKRSAEPV
ncbi:hypothetical protein ACSMX9_18745 [Streptomyces sp. LE64]|uniref:hypothetical protein n=1 Tax=Streptomyces sp. LE64 TaxID=3448653 RepID=UPI0040437A74